MLGCLVNPEWVSCYDCSSLIVGAVIQHSKLAWDMLRICVVVLPLKRVEIGRCEYKD